MDLSTKNKGKRIMLIHMSGEEHMKKGLLGTIKCVDDIGQIHVNWDNGSNLALVEMIDKYKILSDKDIRRMKLERIKKN